MSDLVTATNAAMVRWSEALQQEADRVFRRAARLQSRGHRLPPDWQVLLAEACRAHSDGLITSSALDRILRHASASLDAVTEVRS